MRFSSAPVTSSRPPDAVQTISNSSSSSLLNAANTVSRSSAKRIRARHFPSPHMHRLCLYQSLHNPNKPGE